MKQIAVDVGGTFTDLLCYDADTGQTWSTKVNSTSQDLSLGVLKGVDKLLEAVGCSPHELERFVHGTTIGTNAIVQRAGAVIGILMTKGFEDTLEIGRTRRSDMYNIFLDPETPGFLAPGRFRVGITERMDSRGDVVTPLHEEEVRLEVIRLRERLGVQAIAVCYLFSFLNPSHEMRTKEIVQGLYPDLPVSISSEVNPVFREYERLCVTAFDAYVSPATNGYIQNLGERLREPGIPVPLQIMQSSGGITRAELATQRAVPLILSGPAAGVIGAQYVGEQAGYRRLITMDMGGTSCDISLVREGQPLVSTEGTLGKYPLQVPMVDVNTIGAGGGSVAWTDAGGLLQVGPRSAGAEPGPACYGRGGSEPTVTDASLYLGYLNPDSFGDGSIDLDVTQAEAALQQVASPLGMSVAQAALAVHQVINVKMADAMRLVSVRRGHDPRHFALVLTGGAGPVHGGDLMRSLETPVAIVPPTPGVLSALGLLVASIRHEQVVSVHERPSEMNFQTMGGLLEGLEQQNMRLMVEERVPLEQVTVSWQADMRYVGQSYELRVPMPAPMTSQAGAELVSAFHRAHEEIYSVKREDQEVEIVNLRSIHTCPLGNAPRFPVSDGASASPKSERLAMFPGLESGVLTPVYDRRDFPNGDEIFGPGIIEQADTTTVVYPGQRCRVDGFGNLLLTIDKGA